MKGATAVSSATVLAHRLPIQLILVSVRIQQLYSYSWSDKFVLHPHPGIVLHVAELPSTQQLDVLKLAPQTAELQHRLQEAEYQKQQAELEREATVQEMKARQNFKVQLHAQLGKL